jgi:hypothetical protein
MSFSRETTEKIRAFAREQSRHYLEQAEMTYLENLRRKSSRTKSRVLAKLAKFKSRSETAVEAENDLVLYMSDYMNDLMAEGLSEEEAFERAKNDLQYRSDTEKSADLRERISSYYETLDPAVYEAIGLFYAGFLFFGGTVGALAGLAAGGGRGAFLAGGWIDTLIGVADGGAIGIGFGLISHAVITLKRKP